MTRNTKPQDANNATASTGTSFRNLPEPTVWKCTGAIVLLAVFFFREFLLGTAFLWEDMLYYSYPVRSFAATSMALGQLPLWNPYTFNGMPFLADIQTAVFYLPLTILTFFVRDGGLNFYWLQMVVIAHYMLAGIGMFYLSLSMGLRRIPSLFAAIVYMLSGFMITHAIHQQVITLVAWYPLIFLMFRRAILGQGKWTWVFACGLILGHSTLAGYPQLSLYLYCFLFAYFFFELLTTHRSSILTPPALQMAAKAACIVILSIAVSMIQLLPTYELAGLSQRAEITYEKSTEGSLAWSQLVTFFYPKLFGSAGAGGYNYRGPGPYWHYWETCIYVGASPLLLMCLSFFLIRGNKEVAFFWGTAIFVILFALGSNFFLHKLFFDFVPGFSKFRNPARMGIFFTFAAAVLSGFSLQALLSDGQSNRERRNWRNLLMMLFGIAALVWLLLISGLLTDAFPFMKNHQIFALVKKELTGSILVLTVSATTLYVLLMKRTWSLRWLILALFAILCADLLHFGGDQNTARLDPADYFSRPKRIVDFLRNEGKSEIFRVNTRNAQGMIMDRNQGMVDRIFMMEGYTPLVLQRAYAPYRSSEQSLDLLNVKYKTVTDESAGALSLVPHPTYLPRAFMVYDVRVVEKEDELVAHLKRPDFDHRATALVEKNPDRTIVQPTGPVEWDAHITRYENNFISLDVKTGHDGLLVLSEIYYPGWTAHVDGTETEILQANYNLRSIVVPEGAHTVELRFEPKAFTQGTMITLASIAVCGLGVLGPRIRSKWTKGRADIASSTKAL